MKKLLLIFTCLLLVATCSGQEAAKNKVFAFKDWSGGIATKLVDTSTDPKYARIAENVRLNTALKAITKRDQLYLYGSASATDFITGMHRLYQSDLDKALIINNGSVIKVGNDSTGVFSTIMSLTYPEYRWQWVTWHDLAIGGDGYNQPVKTDGTYATYLGAPYCADAGSGAGPNGTYNYKVTCHTASYSLGFNQVSNNVTVVDNDINLSMIPIGPDTFQGESVAWRNVYRSDNTGAGTYKLLSNGKISNNTSTTLTDSDADAALGANYPTTTETWTPPKGKYYVVHRNRLWIANNPDNPSRIYYSDDSSHDCFDPTAYFDIRENDGDEITFIKNLLGILTIGKTNTIQKLYTTGDDPAADWEISDPFSFIGCDAPHSAVNTPIGIFYLSRAKSGIYVFNGQNSVLKSEQATPVIQDILASNLDHVWSEYNNNLYYMAYPSSTEGGSTNNRLLVYDMLADAYTIDTLAINCMTSFTGSSDAGELAAGSSVNGSIYTFSNANQTIIHNKHSDFTGTWAHSRYLPVDIGGDPNSPVIEIAWSCTVDQRPELVDTLIGDVDRSAYGGTYISQILETVGANAYDKLYWNEDLTPAHAGCHASFAVRGGSSHTACHAASWSSEYTSSSGSDLSGLTAYPYTQYRISLGTWDRDYSPEIYTLGGFTVKLSYKKLGTAAESAIAMHWQTGWLDFGVPAYRKTLRKIVVYHEGTNGTLTITFTNEHGDTDSFDIDLATYPTFYEDYFTNGAFIGTKIKMDVTNSDLNALKVKEIVLVGDIEPIY